MKPLRRKLLGVVIVVALVLPFGVSVAEAFRQGRQQAANRTLIAAIKKNDAKAVTTTLAKGADPNAKDLPPDPRGVWQRVWDSLRRKRLQTGDAPTALLVALEMNDDLEFPPENVPIVKVLLDAGANVNVSNKYGQTPLICAAVSPKRETVRLLLDRGAKINARDNRGCTALFCAASTSDTSVVQLLLARGAQVNITHNDGISPLAVAALEGETPNVRLLLESSSEVNSRDTDGDTPLLNAAMRDHADCVKLLLARGAQVNTKNNEGDTPLSLAQGNKDAQVIKMLKDAGAKK
jgi:ankyrin repeat protein